MIVTVALVYVVTYAYYLCIHNIVTMYVYIAMLLLDQTDVSLICHMYDH